MYLKHKVSSRTHLVGHCLQNSTHLGKRVGVAAKRLGETPPTTTHAQSSARALELDIHMPKNKARLFLILSTKINSKWIVN
jgi:hypothetical protein